MKKKLVILNKDAHWWAKQKVDWATQDKDGQWWIIPGSEFPEKTINKKTMEIKKSRIRETSLPANIKWCLLILLSSLLGVSLAINVILYLVS